MKENKMTGAVRCGHCDNKAPMIIVAEHSQVETIDMENAPFTWDEGDFYQVLECLVCKNVTFRQGYWHEHLSEFNEINYQTLYPKSPSVINGLPENIEKSYSAAQKIKNIDSNAFAVLLGRVLDLICMDKHAEGDTLFSRLKNLADRGIMPQQLADMAHQLRQLRNIGAHADLGELTVAEIPILEALIKAILEYVYSAPNLVQLVQSKIEAMKAQKP